MVSWLDSPFLEEVEEKVSGFVQKRKDEETCDHRKVGVKNEENTYLIILHRPMMSTYRVHSQEGTAENIKKQQKNNSKNILMSQKIQKR